MLYILNDENVGVSQLHYLCHVDFYNCLNVVKNHLLKIVIQENVIFITKVNFLFFKKLLYSSIFIY